MNKGVVIIALGYGIYGGLAFNLALSIKSNDPSCNISLIHDTQAISKLKDWHLQYFDRLIEIPKSDFNVGDHKEFQRAKLLLYKYSPYDYTIYLDADVIWNPDRSISWLFGTLLDKEFEVCNAGIYDLQRGAFENPKYTLWEDVHRIIKYWNLSGGRLFMCQTTFMYFKKSDKVKEMFETALAIYDDKKAPCKVWANGKPDEYCFNIALHKTGLEPTFIPYVPVYIHGIGGSPNKENMRRKFWAISNCGHKVDRIITSYYNDLVDYYCTCANIPDRLYHRDKMSVIPERSKG